MSRSDETSNFVDLFAIVGEIFMVVVFSDDLSDRSSTTVIARSTRLDASCLGM